MFRVLLLTDLPEDLHYGLGVHGWDVPLTTYSPFVKVRLIFYAI